MGIIVFKAAGAAIKQKLNKMKAGISRKTNSKGIDYALCGDESGFEVWKLCENYNPHVKGSIKKVWRYVAINLSEADALTLFKLRTK